VVFLNECDEIRWRVARERRLGEVRVVGQEIFGLAVKIREVTASTAGDENLFANALSEVDEGDATSTFACFDRAHQSGGAGSQDYDVEFVFQGAPEKLSLNDDTESRVGSDGAVFR
jgi:hypothetical protein